MCPHLDELTGKKRAEESEVPPKPMTADDPILSWFDIEKKVIAYGHLHGLKQPVGKYSQG